jgi:hypothetical protein
MKGGVGNKKTSFFSKAKTTPKNKCPHMAQPTGVRASRKEDDHIGSATPRAELTNEKQVPSPQIEFKMCNPKRSTMEAIRKRSRTITSDIGRTCSKAVRSLKVPSSWRRSPRKEEDCIRSPTARAEQTNVKQVPTPKTEFEMCNPKASCSHTINETGEGVAAVKDIKITVREQTKEKQEVLFSQKGSGDFVEIHLSISAGNCQGGYRRVEGGLGNKNTSIFSKTKTNLENKCPGKA